MRKTHSAFRRTNCDPPLPFPAWTSNYHHDKNNEDNKTNTCSSGNLKQNGKQQQQHLDSHDTNDDDDDDKTSQKQKQQQQRLRKRQRSIVRRYGLVCYHRFERLWIQQQQQQKGGDDDDFWGWCCWTFMVAMVCLVVGTSLFLVGSTLLWTFKHAQCFTREAGVIWEEGPTHDLSRPCPSVNYATYTQHEQSQQDTSKKTSLLSSSSSSSSSLPHICITTLTDEQSSSWWQRTMRCRDFDRVGQLTWPNRQAYANKYGYTLVDYSQWIDGSRPPAWSKIKAVQSLLSSSSSSMSSSSSSSYSTVSFTKARTESSHNYYYNNTTLRNHRHRPHCDWIFWMDADTVIMNSSIRIESFSPIDLDNDNNNNKHASSSSSSSSSSTIDLIVTMDRRFVANSGAWLLRANSDWSRNFLQQWWDMNDWVRPHGYSLSGDNAAFGHLVEKQLQNQQEEEKATTQENKNNKIKIQMVPRCTFNSFGVYVKKNRNRKVPVEQEEQEWYQSPNFYHKGDFVAHASGIDQKAEGIQMLLQKAL